MDLRQRLRIETRFDHDLVDAAMTDLQLDRREGLIAWLQMHRAELHRLEPVMAQLGANAPPVISHLIDADLMALGVNLPVLPIDRSAMHLHPLGLTYVIAGSHFGAKVLRERWRLSHDVSVKAAHHMLNSELMALYWPRFVGLLNATKPDQAETVAIIAAAKACFNGFGRSFELANQEQQGAQVSG